MSNIAVLRQAISGVYQSAPEVAAQLRSTEVAIDRSIGQIATLTSLLINVRMDSKLSAVVGQEALSSLGEAMNTMIRGRASIVEAHHRLAATGKQLRLDPSSYGGMENKPV